MKSDSGILTSIKAFKGIIVPHRFLNEVKTNFKITIYFGHNVEQISKGLAKTKWQQVPGTNIAHHAGQ